MKGKVEIISRSRYGIKIEGMDKWLNVKHDNIKKIFDNLTLQKGDTIEYAEQDNEITQLKKVMPEVTAQHTTDYDLLMGDTITKVNGMMQLITDAEIRKNIAWDDIIITLFFTKIGRRG